QMPVMDGTQLLPYLAGHYPDLPLIVISGYRDFDYIKHALSANAVDYVL
ncbi:MAG: response regulator, partial [Blautia sp.]|nr:response regulator [Blautia sp.]